jgi:hypothetical protein
LILPAQLTRAASPAYRHANLRNDRRGRGRPCDGPCAMVSWRAGLRILILRIARRTRMDVGPVGDDLRRSTGRRDRLGPHAL